MQYQPLFQSLIKLNKTDKKVTQTKIGEILGMSKQGISSRIARNQDFSYPELEKIFFAYNVPKEEWEKDIKTTEWMKKVKENLVNEYMDNQAYIKTVNLEPLTASCGGGAIISSNLIYDYDESATYSIVRAVGNSMQPTIADGSICIVKNFTGNQIKDNAIYFFSYEDESFIKRLAKNVNELVIMSDNDRYPDIILKRDEFEKLKIYGEVIKNMRDF